MKKETLESIRNRRSIRKYKDEQITKEELDIVLEAGIYAPTARGAQSPKIVAVQDRQMVKKLSAMNAAVMGSNGDPFYGAPTVIIVFADTERPTVCVEDASLVMGNLLLGAYAADLGACWIHRAKEMFESEEGERLKEEWGIEKKYRGVGCCIVGYPDGEAPEAKPRKEDYIIRV